MEFEEADLNHFSAFEHCFVVSNSNLSLYKIMNVTRTCATGTKQKRVSSFRATVLEG